MTTQDSPHALSCDECRLALGVYVVGAIEPAERALVDRHVSGCKPCRDELAALAGIPGLLGRLDEAQVLAVSEPSVTDSDLLERILATAASRRRATRRRMVAAAAAVVLLAGTGGAAYVAQHDESSSAVPAALRLSSTSGSVRAQVTLVPKAWGTSLDLRLSGVPEGERCRMVAVGRDGTTDAAASWRATYNGTAAVTGATAIDVRQIRTVRVVAGDGHTLVTVPR